MVFVFQSRPTKNQRTAASSTCARKRFLLPEIVMLIVGFLDFAEAVVLKTVNNRFSTAVANSHRHRHIVSLKGPGAMPTRRLIHFWVAEVMTVVRQRCVNIRKLSMDFHCSDLLPAFLLHRPALLRRLHVVSGFMLHPDRLLVSPHPTALRQLNLDCTEETPPCWFQLMSLVPHLQHLHLVLSHHTASLFSALKRLPHLQSLAIDGLVETLNASDAAALASISTLRSLELIFYMGLFAGVVVDMAVLIAHPCRALVSLQIFRDAPGGRNRLACSFDQFCRFVENMPALVRMDLLTVLFFFC